MECEIMSIVLESGRESYDLALVHELNSYSVEDLGNNVSRIQKWFDSGK